MIRILNGWSSVQSMTLRVYIRRCRYYSHDHVQMKKRTNDFPNYYYT